MYCTMVLYAFAVQGCCRFLYRGSLQRNRVRRRASESQGRRVGYPRSHLPSLALVLLLGELIQLFLLLRRGEPNVPTDTKGEVRMYAGRSATSVFTSSQEE